MSYILRIVSDNCYTKISIATVRRVYNVTYLLTSLSIHVFCPDSIRRVHFVRLCGCLVTGAMVYGFSAYNRLKTIDNGGNSADVANTLVSRGRISAVLAFYEVQTVYVNVQFYRHGVL